jgi:hypothetical protein
MTDLPESGITGADIGTFPGASEDHIEHHLEIHRRLNDWGNPMSERWVAVDGDDANDGRSPTFAKATIASAVTSLGLSDPDSGGGTIHIGAGTFEEDIQLHSRVLYLGQGRDVTYIESPSGSTNDGCITIDPTYPCIYTRVEHLTIQGGGNAGQHGVYIQGTTETGVGSGMWLSSFTDVKVAGFDGHQIWLRGGDGSFKCPNQFLSFNDIRADANTTHSALMMSGQNGQMAFNNCHFNGPGKGVGTRNIALVSHCSDDFGAVITDATTAYSISFNDVTAELNTLAVYAYNTYSGVVFNNLHVESCTNGVNVEASAGLIFNSPVFGTTGDAGGYAIRAGSGTYNIINQGVPGAADTSWLGEGGGYNQANDPPLWGGDFNGSGNTPLINTSTTLQTYGARTILINGDAGATPIDTIDSPHGTGSSIHIVAWGGGGIAFAAGGNLHLGSEDPLATIAAWSTATFTRFDFGVEWVLTSVI